MAEVKEEWMLIEDFPGYFVSSEGRIKSFRRRKNPLIIKPNFNSGGYYKFSPYKDGIKNSLTVHQCVGVAFLGGPTKKRPCINHKNGIKTDNRVQNLEYCSYLENSKHAIANELANPRRGEENGQARLTKNQVLKIFNSKESAPSLSEKYGVHQTHLYDIWGRRRWGHILNGLEHKRKSIRSTFHKRGEDAPGAKLTEDLVRKIMGDKRVQREIAKEYGTSRKNVSNIKTKKSWKHLWKDEQ